MKKPLITIHNVETNEIINREMNSEEFALYQANLIAQQTAEAEQIAKAEQRSALLEKLGLTEEEAKLLLG